MVGMTAEFARFIAGPLVTERMAARWCRRRRNRRSRLVRRWRSPVWRCRGMGRRRGGLGPRCGGPGCRCRAGNRGDGGRRRADGRTAWRAGRCAAARGADGGAASNRRSDGTWCAIPCTAGDRDDNQNDDANEAEAGLELFLHWENPLPPPHCLDGNAHVSKTSEGRFIGREVQPYVPSGDRLEPVHPGSTSPIIRCLITTVPPEHT